MTKTEYADYETAVAEFLADMDGEPSGGYWSCPECDSAEWDNCDPCPECDADPEAYREPHFSWHWCDCCGSSLGGDRENVIGWIKGARDNGYGDEYEWSGSICTDCTYYLAYGRLDDMTMMEVEASA